VKPPHRRSAVAAASTAVLALAALAGCEVFDSDHRPYTPFPVATKAPEKPPEATPREAAPPPVVAPEVSHEPLVAPSRATEWRIGERNLTAPDGLVFRLALEGGVQGGSEHDIVAWAVGTPERDIVGELWAYPVSGDPRLILAAPGFLPTGPGCSHGARLNHAGPSTITLDIKATCNGALLARAPERSVSVLAPLRPEPLVVGFRLAAPARDEHMDVDVTAKDRDGDGRDDIEMALRFGTADAADVSARFVWLQRAAGLSRDTAEPRASFAELVDIETKRVAAQKGSPEVTERAASIRRLYASLCAQSATPRIFMDDGAALDCGDLQAAFEALTAAEIEAAIGRGQLGEGFAALERHTWFPSGSASGAPFIEKQLNKLKERVVRRKVIKLVPLKALPRGVDPAPHYSPISFHSDGSLLVQTAEGLVRAAPDGRFEYEASDEVDRWPTLVASSSGEQLSGLAFPCERSEVVWLRVAADGTPLDPLPTGLVAPRPGNCGGTGFPSPNISAVGWAGPDPSAFIGAGRVGPAVAAPPPGSAVSPNGRYAVVATRWGLLVTGSEKPSLWLFDIPGVALDLSDCVISNNAQAAACLLGARAQVILPDPKSG